MESDLRSGAKSTVKDAENVKIIQWEDFEHELIRFCSLKSALVESEENKLALKGKLEAHLQIIYTYWDLIDPNPLGSGRSRGGQARAESLNRLNELDEMHEKLEAKRLAHVNLSMQVKVAEDNVTKQDEGLCTELRSLLVAGTSLTVSRNGFEESNRKFVGEDGHVNNLRRVQTRLRKRQQHMVSQVSFLHRVRVLTGPTQNQELESFASNSRLGSPVECNPPTQGVLTISGLQFSMLPFKKLTFFADKKEVQRTGTALGYVAHAVLLVASYLKVHLRYLICFGGSHSYIIDPAPSVDSSSSDIYSNTSSLSNVKPVEFPLFLEGQDATRAAYAVFLLNKDIEQLLNFIDVRSLGPRHVLGNLKELYRTIISPEYLDS